MVLCYSRDGPDVWDGEKLYYRYVKSSLVSPSVLTFVCTHRGLRILTAIMDDLNTNRNLKQATDVVLTGCSGKWLVVCVATISVSKHVVKVTLFC